MNSHNEFNEQNRFGSSRFADLSDIQKTQLLKPEGLFCGFANKQLLHLASDASVLIIGGAGSGKLRDLLAYQLLGPNAPQRAYICDPKGELAAISPTSLNGRQRIYFNPWGLHGLPRHKVNPLNILVHDSPTLFPDTKKICAALVVSTGAANAKYFEMKAREWLEALIIDHVLNHGSITFPILYDLINDIEANPDIWEVKCGSMLSSQHSLVRRVAAEMDDKKANSPREYGAVFGEMSLAFNWLSDPCVRECLDDGHSLEDLEYFYFMSPAQYLANIAPLNRCMFTVTALFKNRHPQSERIHFFCDEAAQLGGFEELLNTFVYGRGLGLRAIAVYQDLGQISRNFGREGMQTFIGSAQMRIFMGIRDHESADIVSRMLGDQSLEYNAVLNQYAAQQKRKEIVRASIFEELDPYSAGIQLAQHKHVEDHRTKQHRRLMTPAEIMAMPEHEMLVFISGIDCPPIRASKYPYYEQRDMAGRYLPNPFHPPLDKVRVKTRFGYRWKKVIEANGLRYVEGFR